MLRKDRGGGITIWWGCQEGSHTRTTVWAADRCPVFGHPQMLPLFLSTPLLLIQSKFCMKTIRTDLAVGSRDADCNFYRSPSGHFTRLPQLRGATPLPSLQVPAASSCQGAAATCKHPERKMPAMAKCEGNRQNRSTPCHSAFVAVPSSTEVLKC